MQNLMKAECNLKAMLFTDNLVYENLHALLAKGISKLSSAEQNMRVLAEKDAAQP